MPSADVRRPAVALAALVVAGSLAGCGSAANENLPAASSATTTAHTREPAPSSAASTDQPVDSTPETSAAPAPPATELTGLLLDGKDLPGPDAQLVWGSGTSGPAPATPFGLCQRFDFSSIGASDAVERDFTPPAGSDATAAEQVADFPDVMNTHRAAAVLTAWHDRCASRLPNASHVEVHPITAVQVSNGTGSWYLVSFVPAGGAGELSATGIVVSGTRIALLQMTSSGQDHSYVAGQEPMALAVRAAAEKLG